MKILSTLTVSGGLNMASNAQDTFTIGTPLENNDGNVDDLYVYANADFKNNVILGSSSVDIITVSGNLVINPVATAPTSREGQLYYDSNLHALMQNTEVANVPVRLGRSLLVRAKNTDSVTLTKGMAVRISAPQGANKTFVRALSVNIPLTGASGNQIIGIVNDNIAVNSFGYATTFGELENLNTIGLVEGNEIYVSNTTSGSLTGSRPTAPYEVIPIGICISAHANQGKIFVKSRDPLHFGDITGFNPDVTNLLDGQVIRYISSDGTWGNSNSGVKLTGSFSGSFVGTTVSASSGVSASVYYGDGSQLSNIALSQDVTSSGGQLIINSELVPSGNINIPSGGNISFNNNIAISEAQYDLSGFAGTGAYESGSKFTDAFGNSSAEIVIGHFSGSNPSGRDSDVIDIFNQTAGIYVWPDGIDFYSPDGFVSLQEIISALQGGGGGGGGPSYLQTLQTTGSGESIVRDVNNGTGSLRSLKSTSTVNVIHQTNEVEFEVNPNLTLTSITSQGTLTVSGNVQLNDSTSDRTTIQGVLKLSNHHPLPNGEQGMIAMSGSGLFFHNGDSWTIIAVSGSF